MERKRFFVNKGRSIQGISPTLAALEQHGKRCTYLSGYLSCNVYCHHHVAGMVENEWQYEPLLTTLPEAAKFPVNAKMAVEEDENVGRQK